jgi:hypothetical protein
MTRSPALAADGAIRGKGGDVTRRAAGQWMIRDVEVLLRGLLRDPTLPRY